MMKRSKEWFRKRIALERGESITAGTPESSAPTHDVQVPPETHVEQPSYMHGTFSRFVQIARRNKRLTLDQLAVKANVELAELVSIENDPRYLPHPRTVVLLSKFFGVSSKSLLKLSGLAKVDAGEPVAEAAVKFAASSKGMDSLTAEERKALAEFVRALSQ